MPTIRDLVGAIRQREGVEAAVVLGRDGLLIDGQAEPGLDAEHVAAHVPQIVSTADEFGAVAARGTLADAVLLVLVKPNANVGQLLFELRRNREHIAALV
jgi:predicted regulator of Ras-like GTPase activity (Roadblock/LC7/MglB family)